MRLKFYGRSKTWELILNLSDGSEIISMFPAYTKLPSIEEIEKLRLIVMPL